MAEISTSEPHDEHLIMGRKLASMVAIVQRREGVVVVVSVVCKETDGQPLTRWMDTPTASRL